MRVPEGDWRGWKVTQARFVLRLAANAQRTKGGLPEPPIFPGLTVSFSSRCEVELEAG